MLLILASPTVSRASGRLLNTSAATITFATSPPMSGLTFKQLVKYITFQGGLYLALSKEL